MVSRFAKLRDGEGKVLPTSFSGKMRTGCPKPDRYELVTAGKAGVAEQARGHTLPCKSVLERGGFIMLRTVGGRVERHHAREGDMTHEPVLPKSSC